MTLHWWIEVKSVATCAVRTDYAHFAGYQHKVRPPQTVLSNPRFFEAITIPGQTRETRHHLPTIRRRKQIPNNRPTLPTRQQCIQIRQYRYITIPLKWYHT
jgi:hypothetical protein